VQIRASKLQKSTLDISLSEDRSRSILQSIDLEAQIKSLPLVQLEELGEALLDFSQMSDLVAWLDR
jgi:Domain of unknown function (DUF4351)